MLMYEIWSLGHKPFEDVTNPKVLVIKLLLIMDHFSLQYYSIQYFAVVTVSLIHSALW